MFINDHQRTILERKGEETKSVIVLVIRWMKKYQTAIISLTLIALFLILVLCFPLNRNIPQNQGTSYPYGGLTGIDGVAIIISPNGTNIPCNTPIQVETWRPTYVGNPALTPNVPILNRVEKTVVVASLQVTFNLARPLQPNTTYVVSIPVMDEIISWNFTTAGS